MRSGVKLLPMGLCMLGLLLDFSGKFCGGKCSVVSLTIKRLSCVCLMQFLVSSGRLLHLPDNPAWFSVGFYQCFALQVF